LPRSIVHYCAIYMISKPVLEIVPSRRPYPGGRRFGQAGTAWQTVIMSGRPCRRDAAGLPARPGPARLAHPGRHRRELVLPVRRVAPALEPDAGAFEDPCQRFKHPPSDPDAVRLPAFLFRHDKAGMRASQSDQHDPGLITAWSCSAGPVPGDDPAGAHFRGLACCKIIYWIAP